MADSPRVPELPRLGSPNTIVEVRGLNAQPWRDVYPYLLSANWPRLIAIIVGFYLAMNLLFGALFWLDPGGIENARPGSFADAFNFSVQTWGTIGYGKLVPTSTYAHVVVTTESVTSMLFIALLTGLLFAKFSRPNARVMFSRVAVVSDWDGTRSLILRLANQRGTHIGDAQCRMAINLQEHDGEGNYVRRTFDLPLVRNTNPNFVFAWTVIHPIDEASPLHGRGLEDLHRLDVIIHIAVQGIDEIYGQTVYARHRYLASDVRFGEEFRSILGRTSDGKRLIDYTHFHDTEPEQP